MAENTNPFHASLEPNPWDDPVFAKQAGGDPAYHELLVKRHVAHLSLNNCLDRGREFDDRIDWAGTADSAVTAYEKFVLGSSSNDDY